MPNVPGWFQATDYFYNKLGQMQATTGEGYTAQNLLAAFNAAGFTVSGLDAQQLYASADQLFRHFNEWGNAENVSPNNYFDVDYYIQQKIAQCKATGQVPPDGYGEWTPESLWAALQNAGIQSYWDHYTMYGTEEGINPSAAFDTDDYLKMKADQLNSVPLEDRQLLPDGTQGVWTPALVAEAFKNADLNAVEHYMLYNASENIGYVPGPENPAVSRNLTAENDIVGDDGISTTFVGDVAVNPQDSTLNPGDQITGTMRGDVLKVTLNDDFEGFSGNGFMKGVESVDLTNALQDGEPVTWSAEGSTGVTNYDVNGWVNLENLAQTGITVNYSNINNRGQGNALIDFANTGANNDQLNINIGPDTGWLNFQTSGIETITLNSNESAANLNTYADGMQNLVLKGDAVYNIRTMTLSTESLDMSALTSDGNFVCLSRSEGVNQILGGSGNDSVSVRNLAPNAIVDGGAGDDSVKLRSTVGAYQLDMKNVETLNVAMAANLDIEREPNADPGARLILDGSSTTGLKTFGIAGGNGYQFEDGTTTPEARPIYFTKYDMGQVDVKVTGKNFVDLNIDTIKNVTMNVGDGSADSVDAITGKVNLLDAQAVTVNTTDNNSDANAATPFEADLFAAKANNLTLGTAQNSAIDIKGGDLSSVAQLGVSGYSDVTIADGTLLSNGAKTVSVNASNLLGGDFTASFVNNTTEGGAKLNYTGTTTGVNDITVDHTYNTISVTGGLLADTLTIDATNATAENPITVTGNLGGGDDKVVIIGNGDYVNLNGLKGDYTLQPGSPDSTINVPAGEDVQIQMDGSGTVNMGGNSKATIDVGDEGGTVKIEPTDNSVGNIATVNGLGNGKADIIQFVTPDPTGSQPSGALGGIVNGFSTADGDKLALGDMYNGFGPYGEAPTLGGAAVGIPPQNLPFPTNWWTTDLNNEKHLPSAGALEAIANATGIQIAPTQTAKFISGNDSDPDETNGTVWSNNAIVWGGDGGTYSDGGTFVMAGIGSGITVVFLAGVQFQSLEALTDCLA